MSTKTQKPKFPIAQNPLILRCHRLMEAFAKSDDERDFYVDRVEGFIVYVDLDKSTEELEKLEKDIESNPDRYCLVPKLSFYEMKKIMEGFVNEKVYDIDTKEKLLDIIQSKEARENFLEFIYDHLTELEKWQQYYQERSRIRIIEWLRKNEFYFVFEEDVDINLNTMERVKEHLFEKDGPRDVQAARKVLSTKAKTYYSSEALNPRPKRGRPPKQTAKTEAEPQVSQDIYTTVPTPVRPFLFIPDITSASGATFSSKFESEEELLASKRISQDMERDLTLSNLNKKLASLRDLSSRLMDTGMVEPLEVLSDQLFDDEDDDEDVDLEREKPKSRKKASNSAKVESKTAKAESKAPAKKAPAKAKTTTKKPSTKEASTGKKASAKTTKAKKK